MQMQITIPHSQTFSEDNAAFSLTPSPTPSPCPSSSESKSCASDNELLSIINALPLCLSYRLCDFVEHSRERLFNSCLSQHGIKDSRIRQDIWEFIARKNQVQTVSEIDCVTLCTLGDDDFPFLGSLSPSPSLDNSPPPPSLDSPPPPDYSRCLSTSQPSTSTSTYNEPFYRNFTPFQPQPIDDISYKALKTGQLFNADQFLSTLSPETRSQLENLVLFGDKHTFFRVLVCRDLLHRKNLKERLWAHINQDFDKRTSLSLSLSLACKTHKCEKNT